MMKPSLVTYQLKFRALSIILCKTMKKTLFQQRLLDRTIGLVVPAKFSAYAADRRVADILSKEILKIKTKYSHFDLQYEEDKKLCKRPYLLETEKS